jgi:hypothetical protein
MELWEKMGNVPSELWENIRRNYGKKSSELWDPTQNHEWRPLIQSCGYFFQSIVPIQLVPITDFVLMEAVSVKKAGKVQIAVSSTKRPDNVYLIVLATVFLTSKLSNANVTSHGSVMTAHLGCVTSTVDHMDGKYNVKAISRKQFLENIAFFEKFREIREKKLNSN